MPPAPTPSSPSWAEVMTVVRVRGFKIFKDRHGKWRCYHRSTGTRVDLVKHPLGSAEFFSECVRITGLMQVDSPPKPGTLGLLITRYRADAQFLDNLAPRTRSDYQKVFDYLKPIEDTALVAFDTPIIVRIRDKAAAKRGRRFGTYVKQVLSTLFEWGRERGYLKDNPARGVKAVKAPRDAPEANRPWSDAERDAVLAALPGHLKAPIALMMFCGIDPQDAVSLPRSCIRDGAIDVRRGKTKVAMWIPLPAPLKAILAASPQHSAITVCAASHGRPWTGSGLRASWRPIRIALEKANKVEPGLTLKGLRHTVATILAEMGYDERTIADMLGQKTTQMARHYARRADRTRKLSAVVESFEVEVNARRTRSVKLAATQRQTGESPE